MGVCWIDSGLACGLSSSAPGSGVLLACCEAASGGAARARLELTEGAEGEATPRGGAEEDGEDKTAELTGRDDCGVLGAVSRLAARRRTEGVPADDDEPAGSEPASASGRADGLSGALSAVSDGAGEGCRLDSAFCCLFHVPAIASTPTAATNMVRKVLLSIRSILK